MVRQHPGTTPIDAWPILNLAPGQCSAYSYDAIERLHFVLNDVLANLAQDESPEIFPPAPLANPRQIQARRITSPFHGQLETHRVIFHALTGDDLSETWSTPFTLPEGWQYHFAPHRVPAEHASAVRNVLATIERTRMYGKFSGTRAPGRNVPYLEPTHEFARYGRVYDLTDEAIRGSFRLDTDRSYEGRVLGERARRVWVECTVPVDSNWIPVGQPLRAVVPIAVETDRALYVYSQEVVPEMPYGGFSDRFGCRVLDVSGCLPLAACVENAKDLLRQELTRQFQQASLAATLSSRGVAPPGRIRLQRITEPSEVLTGMAGPYYEMSTYTLNIWAGPEGEFLGTTESFFDAGPDSQMAAPDQIFLQVEQALQLAVGRKGVYEEPSVDQYAAYQRAVDRAIQAAVTKTTERLGGTVRADGIGVIATRGTSP